MHLDNTASDSEQSKSLQINVEVSKHRRPRKEKTAKYFLNKNKLFFF